MFTEDRKLANADRSCLHGRSYETGGICGRFSDTHCHDGPMKHKFKTVNFCILLAVHLGTIHVNNQLDALFNVFISLLYMFQETQ